MRQSRAFKCWNPTDSPERRPDEGTQTSAEGKEVSVWQTGASWGLGPLQQGPFFWFKHVIRFVCSERITNESSSSFLQITNNRSSLLTVLSCALDRISSYTVSLLKRHYSIDDVLSRVSSPLRWPQLSNTSADWRLHTLQREAVKPLPLLSFSNGKGSPAFSQCHRDQEDRLEETLVTDVLFMSFWQISSNSISFEVHVK